MTTVAILVVVDEAHAPDIANVLALQDNVAFVGEPWEVHAIYECPACGASGENESCYDPATERLVDDHEVRYDGEPTFDTVDCIDQHPER